MDNVIVRHPVAHIAIPDEQVVADGRCPIVGCEVVITRWPGAREAKAAPAEDTRFTWGFDGGRWVVLRVRKDKSIASFIDLDVPGGLTELKAKAVAMLLNAPEPY